MSVPRLVWEGDVQGSLRLGSSPQPLRSVEALATRVREPGLELDGEECALLGGFALLLCIRDVRVGRAGLVLPTAQRRLQAACGELLDGEQARAFRLGVETLAEDLHPTRGEPHHVLAYLAWLHLERRLEEARR